MKDSCPKSGEKGMRKRKYVVLLSLILSLEMVVGIGATTLSNAKSQQKKTQKSLDNMESQISTIEDEKAQADEKLDQLQGQLVDILTSISICEEEIEAKKIEIDDARDELMVVEKQEEEQYESMKRRVKFMYEHGEKAYFQILLESSGYAEMVNKADYVEKLYAYDKDLLATYVANKEKVKELKGKLEDEEADLEAANRELAEEQKALETLVAEQKDLVADFDQKLTNAKAKAESYKAQLEEQTKQIKVLEKEEQQRLLREAEEKRRRQQEERLRQQSQATGDSTGDGESSIDVSESDDANFTAGAGDSIEVPASSGSGLGLQVVNYACQFVGNPYVYGGTSLTDGTDCSGFTMSVYAHFGISIPRDSTSQRSCGIGVDLANAQAGDIVCYAGHVGLYMGNGMIVHASTERTGITYSPVNYRTILAVRRVIY